MQETSNRDGPSIWWFAFGYFVAYVPYSALTKHLTNVGAVTGNELLPLSALASMVGMFAFLTAMGWWRYTGRRSFAGLSIPMPSRWTLLSGLCTAAIIPTTTLAYTFSGISIVFMMLLMRGGVLIIAPIVDFISRRRVRWFSWVALGLSIAALLAAFSGKASYNLTVVAIVDLAIYLAAYFVRLRFMSRLAKSDDNDARLRYFVEEQMVATPALVLTLAVWAFGFDGPMAHELRFGFTDFWQSGYVMTALVIGLFSQGTGVFGGLVLLDKRENTFCVPVNRASSILAGLCASALLAGTARGSGLGGNEIIGAVLILTAIVALSVPPLIRKRIDTPRVAAPTLR